MVIGKLSTVEPPPPPPVTGGVPDGAHCASVADWDPMWAQWEDEVLMLTNEWRAKGYNCDTMGVFGPAGPVVTQPNLRCSSRLHALDMGQKGYFAHESQDGKTPFDRMMLAGYSGFMMGENIAQGQTSPTQVVQGWLESDERGISTSSPWSNTR